MGKIADIIKKTVGEDDAGSYIGTSLLAEAEIKNWIYSILNKHKEYDSRTEAGKHPLVVIDEIYHSIKEG